MRQVQSMDFNFHGVCLFLSFLVLSVPQHMMVMMTAKPILLCSSSHSCTGPHFACKMSTVYGIFGFEFFQFLCMNVKKNRYPEKKMIKCKITFFSFCKIRLKPISQGNAKHRKKMEWPNYLVKL